MELALSDGIWISGIRIKLRFEDRTILSPQQVDDGLLNSWFGVRPHLHCIADLASDIASNFQLSESCPHGIALRVEKFTLPPLQPVWLLKDKDTVSVTKKVDHSKWVNSLSPDEKAPGTFDVCTIEVSKDNARDYNTEKEESGEDSPNQLVDSTIVLSKEAAKANPKHKKKRKRTEHEGVDEQEQGHELHLDPNTRENARKKVKTLKEKTLSVHHETSDDKLHQQDALQECEISRKHRKSVNSKFAKDTEKERRSTKQESRKKKENEQVEMVAPTVKRKADQKNSQQILHLPSCLNGVQVLSQEKKLMTQAEDEFKKKPSRSTLRKKAKRRWKREHPESCEGRKVLEPLGLSKDISCADNGKTYSSLQDTCPNINEDDGEAEEEKLPIIVRPGHIRFVHSDEDEEINPVQHSMDIMSWNNVKSKRQGQNWGQEKVQGKKNGKKFKETVLADSEDVIGDIVFDSLPCLKLKPQVDDIIAYRIVELTPLMCPELSEYRVGKVGEFETESEMLKLLPLPNYSPWKRMLDDPAQEESCDMSFSSLYDEDGALEIQLVSLVDVRLVRAAVNVAQVPLNPQVQVFNVMTKTDMHEDDPAEDAVQLFDVVDGQEALSPAKEGLINNSKTSITCSPTIKSASATSHPDVIGKGISHDLASAWQDLSEMLDKRKVELSRLEAVTQTSQSNGSAAFNAETAEHDCISGAKVQDQKPDSKNRSRSYRPRRAGALGPIMTLLRAQNGL